MKFPVLLLLPVLGAGFISPGVCQAQGATPAAGLSIAPAPSKDVNPEAAARLLQDNPQITVLDVRTPAEFATGHLRGAVNISSADPEFLQKLSALDSTRPLILHCAAGGRSARVLPSVRGLHFPAVYHLNGGIHAWVAAGKPLVK